MNLVFILTKLSLFQRNSSSVGAHTVHTGASNIERIGEVLNFNFKDEFPSGKDDIENCSRKLYGKTGDIFFKKNNFIDIFVPEFCATLQFDKMGNSKIEGIDGITYACKKLKNSKCKTIEQNLSDFLDISTCR